MKFSIVTPSFNQGQFIERTLRSVASQSGAEIEHVVFDGGSTELDLHSVPFFLFDGRFGVSGAQEPTVLLPLIDLALVELPALVPAGA